MKFRRIARTGKPACNADDGDRLALIPPPVHRLRHRMVNPDSSVMTNSAARPHPSRGIAKHPDFPGPIGFHRRYHLLIRYPRANDRDRAGAHPRPPPPPDLPIPRIGPVSRNSVTSEIQLPPETHAIPPYLSKKVV